MKTTKINVKGMYCVSCEMLIKKSLEDIDGVQVKSISSKSGEVHVGILDDTLVKKIKEVIETSGYKVMEKGDVLTKKINWINLLISVFVVGIVAIVFYKIDISQYIPSTSGGDISLGIALLIGIVASLSTCLAIVGSIVLGFSQYTKSDNNIKTQLSFHAGRIFGFFLLGGLLGFLGQAISISLTMTTIITVFVGIIVLWMGLHLLNILPNITSLGFHLPKSWSEKTLETKNPIFAPLIGALTFFLPCGFTLSMQLVAINTSSFRQGGLVMAMFALGTMPVLLAVGLGSSYIKKRNFKLLNSIIGTLVVFFGVLMITNARHMFGGLAAFTENTKDTNMYSTNISSLPYERIEVGHNGRNLVPETINLIANKNYELIITPSENGKGCMYSLTIPGLDRKVNEIIKNKPISYKFQGIKKGRYKIVCGSMGMYQGQIVVE